MTRGLRLLMQLRRRLLLLLGLCVLFVLAYQPQKRIDLDVTARSNEKFLAGFLPTQEGTSWTEAKSGIWLPGLGGANLPWRIGLRMSGAGRGRFDSPAHVIVQVNGAMLGQANLSNQEQDYEWRIAPWTLGLNGDLLMEIDSATFKSPIDQQELGVRISHVWLARADGLALPSLRGFVFTILLVCCCGLLLRMSSVGLGATQPMTRTQFFDPWQNAWAWVLVGLWVGIVLVRGLNRPQGAWWLQTVTFGTLVITILVWSIARIISPSLTRQQALRVLILFGLAALVRIPFDFGRGYETDVSTYLSLSWKTVQHGIQSAYVQTNGVLPSDNPPLLLYPFWLLGRFYQAFLSPLFGRTRLSDPDMLRFMLRLPGFIADLVTGALIFRVLRLRGSISFNSVLFATGAYVLNPALIFDSAYWGQTAAIHALFMLLSVILIERNACGWAGAMLATAILTKPQALAIAPLILILSVRQRNLLRFSVGGVAAALLITTPFIITGTIGGVVQEYLRTTEFDPFISVNAHNLWWFLTGGQGWLRDTESVGLISFRTAGLLTFAGTTLLSLAVVWRDRRMLFRAAAYQSLAFFMLNTQIHENHLLPMFAPLVIAVALDGKGWLIYCAFALTAVANMALHDPNLLTRFGYSVEQMVYGTPALALTRWFNALIQSFLFLVFTGQLVDSLRRSLSAGVHDPGISSG
jgi:hypothetical protein